MPRTNQVTKRTNAVLGSPAANATETVIARVVGVSLDRPDVAVRATGWASVSSGVGATGLRLRIYRGVDQTGVLVADTGAVALAASVTDDYDIAGQDAPGVELAGQAYCLTVLVSGGAAGLTINAASLEVSY